MPIFNTVICMSNFTSHTYHTHARTHTHTHTHIHTHTGTHKQHTHRHTQTIHTHRHTQTTQAHTNTHTQTQAHTNTGTHTETHTTNTPCNTLCIHIIKHTCKIHSHPVHMPIYKLTGDGIASINFKSISPWQQPGTFPLAQTIYKMQCITSCDHFCFQPITCQDTGNAPLQSQQILQEIGSYSDHMISSYPTIHECYKPVSTNIHDYWIIALR